MINLDPDTGAKEAHVMKTVVRPNKNNAGVYASVVRTGIIHVGERVWLSSEAPAILQARTGVRRPTTRTS